MFATIGFDFDEYETRFQLLIKENRTVVLFEEIMDVKTVINNKSTAPILYFIAMYFV